VKINGITMFAAASIAGSIGLATAPLAAADTIVTDLGNRAELINGQIVQSWTVSDLRPSSDAIPYPVRGTLWEATASDTAVAGTVTPVVSNFNARAHNGDTYRVLFTVATPQGVNPSTLQQGGMTSGKIYFDVTGEAPDSVFYSEGGPDLALWLKPAQTSSSSGGGSYSSSWPSTSSSTAAPAGAAEAVPPAPGMAPAMAPGTAPGAPGVAPAATTPMAPAAPLPTGSSGTPIPAGMTPSEFWTPPAEAGMTPAGMAPAPAGPAPGPAPAAAPAPAGAPAAGSQGTPLLPAGQPAAAAPEGTPQPANAEQQPAGVSGAPVTTTILPPAPAAPAS
jgi:hypothetical protein